MFFVPKETTRESYWTAYEVNYVLLYKTNQTVLIHYG